MPQSGLSTGGVLVAFASRHGATEEIAQAIAGVLRAEGFQVTCRAAETVLSVDGFRAIVLGSAVYIGKWLSAARDFNERFAAELNARPLWLFSSGPVGTPPKPVGEPGDLAALAPGLRPIEHRRFAGRLNRSLLSFTERAVVGIVGADEGDYRDWETIRACPHSIARQIEATGSRTLRVAG